MSAQSGPRIAAAAGTAWPLFWLLLVATTIAATGAYSVNAAPRSVGTAILGNSIVDGCYHNGTIYHDGSLVPTVEPCLQCKCRNRNLVCSLRICTDLPVPPPRGCVLVQKRGICCAYVTCSKFHKLNEIAQRRGDGHAISRRRLPAGGFGGNALFRGVEEDAMAHVVEGNEKLCVVNGTIYKSGSAMTSSSLCSYCYCIAGRQKCVQPKCLLASPGCEPIYSDSTCCPIRYDCAKKNALAAASAAALSGATADDSNQTEPRAKPSSNVVHHSNKHYLRTKLRTQRSRGCIVGAHFYPEGLKLPSDSQHPCNMCFCIRGAAKCTPKKCAPAIANCQPIIPAGQCCPASYECDHSGDAKAPSKSRQFDFFSMFFADEFENGTTPAGTEQAVTAKPTATASNGTAAVGDSIFAAIEAGLKYIESNDQKVGSLLDGQANLTHRTSTVKPMVQPTHIVSSTTEKELSFLDILLGEDEEEELPAVAAVNHSHIATSTEKILDRIAAGEFDETTVIITRYTTDRATERISTTNENESTFDTSTITLQFTDPTDSTTSGIETTTEDETTITDSGTTETGSTTTESQTHKTNTDSTYASTQQEVTEDNAKTTVTSASEQDTTTQLPVTHLKQNFQAPNQTSPQRNSTTSPIRTTTENIFSALFDGISSMFNEHNRTAAENLNKLYKIRINTDRNATHRTPQSSSASIVKPMPTVPVTLPHRIRNSTAPAPAPTKLHPTPIPLISSSTAAPLIFNSNPSILESELNYDYSEPTLPPSLPNLKIIPFLPTDAVKTNRNNLNYNTYYNANPSASPETDIDSYSFPGESQPVLSLDQLNVSKESKISLDSNEFELFHVGAQMSGTVGHPNHNNHNNQDSGEYIRPVYPSITESIYDLNDPTRFDAETQQKLYPAFSHLGGNHKYPFGDVQSKTTASSSSLVSEAGGNSGYDIVTGYEKFVTAYPEKLNIHRNHEAPNKFSPPVETEGGFVPKEDAYLYDTYHKTMPMIDITTKIPINLNRSEGPFKTTAFKNEPNTFSLTRAPDDSNDALEHDYSSIVLPDIEEDDDDKNIISITTDSTYNYTSEYADYAHTEQRANSSTGNTIDYRHQSLSSLFPGVSTASPYTGGHLSSRYSPSTPAPLTSTTSSDLFGSLFGFLFKDDEQLAEFQRYDETTTIPPFRKITTLVSLDDIFNRTQSTSPATAKRTSEAIPQRINDKVFDELSTGTTEYRTEYSVSSSTSPRTSPLTSMSTAPSTTSTTEYHPSTLTRFSTSTESLPDLNILRDALLGSLSNSDPASLPIPSRHPIYQGSVPFLSPIFQANNEAIESKHSFDDEHNPIRSNLDLILGDLPKTTYSTVQSTQQLPEYSSIPSRQEYVVHNGVIARDPVVSSTVQTFEGAAQIFTKPSPANGGAGSVGLLKLAGCNIYGRMYRVGRIISELSSECLECRCTEVGVNCTPLDC